MNSYCGKCAKYYMKAKDRSGSILSNVKVFSKFAASFKPKHGMII